MLLSVTASPASSSPSVGTGTRSLSASMPMRAAVEVIRETGRRARWASSQPPSPAASRASGPLSSMMRIRRLTDASALSVDAPTRMNPSAPVSFTTRTRKCSPSCAAIVSNWASCVRWARARTSGDTSGFADIVSPDDSSTVPEADSSWAVASVGATPTSVESVMSWNSPSADPGKPSAICDARESSARSMPAYRSARTTKTTKMLHAATITANIVTNSSVNRVLSGILIRGAPRRSRRP